MREDLDTALAAKCPLLFKHLPGTECDDGWFALLETATTQLETIIAAMPVVCYCGHALSAHDAGGACTAESDPDAGILCTCTKYEADPPHATQIKSKFGGLRLYMSHYTDEIDAVIAEAEAVSRVTCESCGAPGAQRSNGGWVFTRCGTCAL